MFRDLLNLVNSVAVVRETLTTDGMGGSTATTATVYLDRAAIWSPTQAKGLISDKIARVSSHVLVTEPASYTFTTDDKQIEYSGHVFRIAGPSDNVMNRNEIIVTPLEQIQ